MALKKKICNILLIPFGVMAVGYIMLVITCLVPGKWIKNEVRESADILSSQGTYPSGYLDGWFLDNFTDADCISIVYNMSTQNPFYNAINAFQLSDEEDTNPGSIRALRASIDGNGKKVGDHSFLWHGFRIWLKPLMIKYNISEIRMILYFVTIFLVALVCVTLSNIRHNMLSFVPFLAAFSFFNFQMESLSLLFFNDLFITLVAILLISNLCYYKKEKYFEEVFVTIGAVVAFSSMLILPMITLGFPLIIALVYEKNNANKLGQLIKCSTSWCFGYGITMITKIFISTYFFGSKKGISSVLIYSGKGDYAIMDRVNMLRQVMTCVITHSVIKRDLVILFLFVVVIYIIVRKRENIRNIKDLWSLIIIANYPCIWCIVCAGHAGHGWTYMNFSISLFALLEMLWGILDLKITINKANDIFNDKGSLE